MKPHKQLSESSAIHDASTGMNASAAAACAVSSPFLPTPICCKGGKGTLLGAGIPFPGIDEFTSDAGRPMVAIAYLVLLLWTFMGVALAADVFMAAIEEVTSMETTHIIRSDNGQIRRFRARVWNATVANLTLMALGSSAPEILLSLIELLSGGWYSGALGPSTIVGSAAFNLLVILAVCVVAIPAADARKIAQPKVYYVTAFASTFAYCWLVIILMVWSPDVIELPEAVLTFLFFPLLVTVAYYADKLGDPRFIKEHPALARLCCIKPGETLDNFRHLNVLMELKAPDGSPASKEEVVRALKQLRRASEANGGVATSSMTDDELYEHLMAQAQARRAPRSRAFYRTQATRKMTAGSSMGSGLIRGATAPKTRLLSVVGGGGVVVGGGGGGGGDVEMAARNAAAAAAEKEARRRATVEFASEQYAVMEGGGSISVSVVRSGDLSDSLSLTYRTEDGTATAGEDYEPVEGGTLHFRPHESMRTIVVKIFDDDVVEEDERSGSAPRRVERRGRPRRPHGDHDHHHQR